MPIALRRILFPRFVRRPIRRLARSPLGRLVGHFLARVVSSSAGQDSEFEFGAGALLGLLAAPGAFNCFLLLDKYSSFLNWLRGRRHLDVLVTSIPDKYLFLSLAMAVTGIVTVLKWDRILPDSQDYINLAPLPIRPRRILMANVTAILIAVVTVALDVNLLPSVLFPLFVTASEHASFGYFLQFAATQAASVLLASFFSICGVFALLGTLAAVLPREAFRACSSWVRALTLLALLALLPTGFAGAGLVRTLEQNPDSPLQYLPTLWYLGLYQSLQHRATPVLAAMERRGLMAAGVVFVLMAISYAFSYRRRFAGVLEGGRKPAEQRLFAALLAVLDVFSCRARGFPRACHRFIVRAMLRSEPHRLAIAVAGGLGWLLACQDILSAPPPEFWDGPPALELLQAPLAAAYLLILGLRLAFEIPAGVSSNWIFRAILDPRENQTLPVARLVILSFLAPAVLLPGSILAWDQSGFPMAAIETLYVLALSVSLIEVQLAGYRKVPLTCPMPGFRDHLPMLCFIQFLGYELFTRGGAAMELWMLRQPAAFLLVPAAMAGAWYWNRRRIEDAREAGELEEGVTFENAPVRAVTRLDL
ncbi:MAG TPA: hypothetical protein VMH81_36045 [Bryobacteraceae bacterium]|nr:hypothetical protein [Bryobacteraceae bacterium]